MFEITNHESQNEFTQAYLDKLMQRIIFTQSIKMFTIIISFNQTTRVFLSMLLNMKQSFNLDIYRSLIIRTYTMYHKSNNEN